LRQTFETKSFIGLNKRCNGKNQLLEVSKAGVYFEPFLCNDFDPFFFPCLAIGDFG